MGHINCYYAKRSKKVLRKLSFQNKTKKRKKMEFYDSKYPVVNTCNISSVVYRLSYIKRQLWMTPGGID